ncbi:MAG TPA: type II secretion system protein [Planctomycetota bacterium]|jgi:prepilin-type N-terminal cleavage/methylation domain-containing protein|nr:type II secretion system protein [Planctomycetota bacterium]OQC20882.1 MAG: hypothetical protein BWX69_01510 [Planctomycetes bacterium ADurb.Bin069]NMD35526.1 type II secretion system protein [Planctomycetota bacterium]HNR99596.1 type II secretion system protein [Planctomycetota bacterium]HNU25661.1 type II secretion system protein [Planctomycetota bacterium]
MMRPARRTGGFTLLEVLISLGILAIGSTCIVALFSAAMETYRRSELEFTATNLALEVLDTAEEIVLHGGALPTLGEDLKKRIGIVPQYTYDVAVEEQPGDAALLTVFIRTDTRGKGRAWTWRRTLIRGEESRLLPLPRSAPKRYP